MEYRLGTCSSCKAQFRVPASFQADRAKCKKCGGVVQIGAVQGAASGSPASSAAGAAAASAAAKPPRPRAERPPAARPRPGPAPAQRASAPRPPASKPAGARPQPGPGAGSKGAARSGSPRPRAKGPAQGQGQGPAQDSVREAAEAAAERVRSAGERGPSKVRPAAVKKAGAGSRSGARRRPAKQKSKTPVLLGLGALVVAAAVGGWFLLGRGQAAEARAADETVALAPSEAAGAPAELAPVEDGTGAALDEPAALEVVEEVTPDEPDDVPAPVADPSVVDLSALAPYGKLAETSEADWAEYQQLAATFVDPAAGAAGNRARAKLAEAGYQAMPAVMNELLKVDLASDQGYQTGDLLQKLLMELCRGNNYGWKYTTEPADQLYNRKAVRLWHTSWGQVEQERRAWILLGKLSEEEGVAFLAEVGQAAPSTEPVGSSETLDDF